MAISIDKNSVKDKEGFITKSPIPISYFCFASAKNSFNFIPAPGSYFSKYKRGKGNVFLCAAPLDMKYNDLVGNGDIFVPMLYKIAIHSDKSLKIAYTIGQDNLLEAENTISNTEMVYKLQGEAEEFIPQQRVIGEKVVLGIGDQVKEAGFYNLYLEESKPLNTFAFNYDRKESNLQYFYQSSFLLLSPKYLKVLFI
mgnify:CR=1 FL=1